MTKETEKATTLPAQQVVQQSSIQTTATKGDKYVQIFEDQAGKIMEGFGLTFTAETKKALFNIVVAIDKTLKDKGITWDNVNKDGLASKILDYSLMELNPANNELYIIPYEVKTNGQGTGRFDLNFDESYRGKRKKAKKFSIDGLIDMPAFLIREGDTYEPEYDIMNGDKINYKPLPFNTGKVIGAVCYLKYEDPIKNKIIEMDITELEKVKEASKKKMFGKLSPAWSEWESEMQKKAVIKRAAKEIEVDIPVEMQRAYLGTEKSDNTFDSNVVVLDEPEQKTVEIEAPKPEIKKESKKVIEANDNVETEMPKFE